MPILGRIKVPGGAWETADTGTAFVSVATQDILRGQPLQLEVSGVSVLGFANATCVGIASADAATGEEVLVLCVGIVSCLAGTDAVIDPSDIVEPGGGGVIQSGNAVNALGIALETGSPGDLVKVLLGLPIRLFD